MPYRYTIHSENNWIELSAWGPVPQQEVHDGFNAYISDPRFKKGMHILVDIRQAELKAGLGSVHALLRQIRENRDRRGTDYRIALLVKYGFQETMCNLFKIYAKTQPFSCRVFKDETSAREWVIGSASEQTSHSARQ
ncbi:MAG: hypothetical protein Kow006_16620 [Gammaproteobacteria bacterium]